MGLKSIAKNVRNRLTMYINHKPSKQQYTAIQISIIGMADPKQSSRSSGRRAEGSRQSQRKSPSNDSGKQCLLCGKNRTVHDSHCILEGK